MSTHNFGTVPVGIIPALSFDVEDQVATHVRIQIRIAVWPSELGRHHFDIVFHDLLGLDW